VPGNSIKQRLHEYLDRVRPEAVTESVWLDLVAQLAPASESYLRDLVRQTGLPFEQPFAGVRQHTLKELEESLRGMQKAYSEAMAAGDRDKARYCRRQVIAAKDRARFLSLSSRMPAEKQALKEEMLDWMLVWLENPEVFPSWVEARKRVLN